MKPAGFAPVYACLYAELAELTRKHGYALAVHGSMNRDFDLVCIPWIDEASDPQMVVDDIISTWAFNKPNPPVMMKHGRLCYSVSLKHGECFLDLSFMPRLICP